MTSNKPSSVVTNRRWTMGLYNSSNDDLRRRRRPSMPIVVGSNSGRRNCSARCNLQCAVLALVVGFARSYHPTMSTGHRGRTTAPRLLLDRHRRDNVSRSFLRHPHVRYYVYGGDGIRTDLPVVRRLCASSNNDDDEPEPPPPPKRTYCTTVCMVPPVHATAAWDALTQARTELRDAGLYRWPPHANLLYPFVELTTTTTTMSLLLAALEDAARSIEPFRVTVDTLGCFGGSSRGVLWAYPRSSSTGVAEDDDDDEEPLLRLEGRLQDAFATFQPPSPQQRQRRAARFVPHMTLSHFDTVEDALAAKVRIERWWESVSFPVEEIYLLRRQGDDGQFEIAATIPLGKSSPAPSLTEQLQDPAVRFPAMPRTEEDWVRERRLAQKRRRNARGGGRGTGKRTTTVRRGPSNSTDTPEEIAAKRAARKEKRERRERELREIEEALEG